MSTNTKQHELSSIMYGIDADKETSLFEYGLLIAPYTKDGSNDEYFCVYSVGNNCFDAGYKHEYELNDLINGKDWASQDDINAFLSYTDHTLTNWLSLSFVHKLSDCIGYWGYENIMGTCYHSIPEETARELYF